MDVGSVSSVSAVQVSSEQQVKVLNSQREQLQAVVGTILQGVEESAPASPGVGQHLNLTA